MKRFLLFSGLNYYPSGGWDDFLSSFDTLEEARVAGQRELDTNDPDYSGRDWWHIVDLEAGGQVDNG